MNGIISKDTLDAISYKSSLNKNLKSISLRETNLSDILNDIDIYRNQSIECILQHNLIGLRFKSEDSLKKKYTKTINAGFGFKQCFNDVLGLRLHLEEYPSNLDNLKEIFRVVDLRYGKNNIKDGYRAIHLYYQRDSYSYPIEVQLWCGKDYFFNTFSHQHLYKYTKDTHLCEELYQIYIKEELTTIEELINKMKELGGVINE